MALPGWADSTFGWLMEDDRSGESPDSNRWPAIAGPSTRSRYLSDGEVQPARNANLRPGWELTRYLFRRAATVIFKLEAQAGAALVIAPAFPEVRDAGAPPLSISLLDGVLRAAFLAGRLLTSLRLWAVALPALAAPGAGRAARFAAQRHRGGVARQEQTRHNARDQASTGHTNRGTAALLRAEFAG